MKKILIALAIMPLFLRHAQAAMMFHRVENLTTP